MWDTLNYAYAYDRCRRETGGRGEGGQEEDAWGYGQNTL